MEIFSANEYWVKAASLMTTDPTGTKDLPDSPFTRIYLMDKEKRQETYLVIVGRTGEQLREEFLALVRKAEPTAIVDVIPSGATVIIKGTVATAGPAVVRNRYRTWGPRPPDPLVFPHPTVVRQVSCLGQDRSAYRHRSRCLSGRPMADRDRVHSGH